MALMLQLAINGLVFGALLGLVALGLALVFGVMRIVNFAHGEFITLGAYVTYFLVTKTGLSPLWGIPLAALLGAAIGLAVQMLVISRLAGRPELDALMTTYALSIVGLGLFAFAFGGDFRTYAAGPSGNVTLGGAVIGWRSITVLLTCAIAGAATLALVARARIGLGFRAVAQNRDAAAACGVNVVASERLAFSVAVALAAICGALISFIGTTTPTVGHEWLLDAFVVVIIGGLGSISGALVAAVALGLLHSFASYFLDDSWAQILIYLLLYVTLLVRPQGLLGARSAT